MKSSTTHQLASFAATLSLGLAFVACPIKGQGQSVSTFSEPLNFVSPHADSVVPQSNGAGTQAYWADVDHRDAIGNASWESSTFRGVYYQSPSAADLIEANELPGQVSDLAWSKGDHKVIPYGSLRGSAVYATRRTSPGAYTLFVLSPDDEGEDTFEIDTRRTRVGLDVIGPAINMFSDRVQVSGKLEVDFHGNFVIENKPGMLLRHAYGEMKGSDWRIIAGQTWDVISPLIPNTLNYSVAWAAGNIGYRRMQIRVERYVPLGHSIDLTLQGSINQNIVSDFRASTAITPESTNWPVLQGRMATSFGNLLAGGPATIGVSGHVGQQGFDINPSGPLPGRDDWLVSTWSFNVDVRLPITERLGFQGEFFTGRDMATELGGILQGVYLDPTSNTLGGIRATGGWLELAYDWNSYLHYHVGYTIDDPSDVAIPLGGRTKNQSYYANAVVDVTKNILLGFEVSSWRTDFVGKTPGDAVLFEFRGMYNF